MAQRPQQDHQPWAQQGNPLMRSWTGTTTANNTNEKKRRPLRTCRSLDLPPVNRALFQLGDNEVNNGERNSRPPTPKRLSFALPFTKQTKQPHEEAPSNKNVSKNEIFEEYLKQMSYSQHDILSIVQEDDAFQNLKASLRNRGCVTNSFLKENIHLYVQHCKMVRSKRVETAVTEPKKIQRRRRRRSEMPTPTQEVPSSLGQQNIAANAAA